MLQIRPYILCFFLLAFWVHGQLLGQTNTVKSCSYQALVKEDAYQRELTLNEIQIKEFLNNYKAQHLRSANSQYIIPVVIHVFHDGEDGKISFAQALSGLEVINRDFAGLNDDFDNVDADFDVLKATLNVSFELAKLDPQGQATTGVVYHDDSVAMLNQTDLFLYAWDNRKYLNIYLPRYVFGEPSRRTGFGYYPSTFNVSRNRDGVIYSSVRWGYGELSELENGDEWASTATHEVGHWLNLFHTFEFGCEDNGDRIEDTPPAVVDSLYLEGCDNTDFSCGIKTNGENYMDYNLRCRKMFTRGQVERMEAALHLSSRNNLWSTENLLDVGLKEVITSTQTERKPLLTLLQDRIQVRYCDHEEIHQIRLYDTSGRILSVKKVSENEYEIESILSSGLYIYILETDRGTWKGKFTR